MAVPPKRVVRFYSNTDYAMQAIGFREITYVRIDQLNDPFDPPFFFITDFGNSYADLFDYVRRNHKEDIQNFSSRLPQENWERLLKNITEELTSIRNSTFIFSACAVTENQHPKDNLYMWSHYGNGHRGIAIEFDTALLTKAVSIKNKTLNGEETQADDVWNKIDYPITLPKITCEMIYQAIMSAHKEFDIEAWRRTKFSDIMAVILRSKSLVWKVENEWRLMWRNNETDLKIERLILLDETITALYLGCRVTDPLKQSLISQVRRSFPKALVYDSKKVHGEFAIKFEVLK